MPEWKKVESPMTPTVFPFSLGPPNFSRPSAMPTEAPMHMQASMAASGLSAPRV